MIYVFELISETNSNNVDEGCVKKIIQSIFKVIKIESNNVYSQIKIGDPLQSGVLVGPLINKDAVSKFHAAIRTAKLLFPEKRIGVLMPAYRGNNHIKSVAHFALKIKPKHYEEYQMPDQVVANDGTVIQKPASW